MSTNTSVHHPGSWLTRTKLLGALGLFVAVLAVIIYASLPRTYIVMGINPTQLDKDGKLTSYGKMQDVLKARGIELRFKSVEGIAPLELMMKDPEIDFVFGTNSGATLPASIEEQFRSLGVTRKVPLVILASPDSPPITHISQLRGKTIAIKIAPNAEEKVTFIDSKVPPTPYQLEYIYANLFKVLNINSENTKLINTYPEPALSAENANYYVGFYAPNQIGTSAAIRKKIETEKYRFVSPIDLDGVAHRTAALRSGTLDASILWPSLAIPSAPVSYLYSTVSAVVRKSLDPSLVMTLSEAVQSEVSGPNTFRKQNEFPQFFDSESFAPHETAADFYKNGKPFLANYVSPTIAALIIKILIVLIPILTIAWPITNFLPKIYSFYVKHKITHWYVDLEMIDKTLATADPETRRKYSEVIDEIGQGITSMRLPIMHTHYAQELFAARAHVELIRRKLNELAKEDKMGV